MLTHANRNQALEILSLEPENYKNGMILQDFVRHQIVRAYSRGGRKKVYNREDLKKASELLDNEKVIIKDYKIYKNGKF